MREWLALALLGGLMAPGCVVYESDDDSRPPPPPPPPPANHLPYGVDADAGVYWDSYHHDDVWYFEAVVDDADGPHDVVAVYADVWDPYYDDYVETFELYPTDDPHVWYSDWLGHHTVLDPFWHDYVVDFTIYDSWDDRGFISTRPHVY